MKLKIFVDQTIVYLQTKLMSYVAVASAPFCAVDKSAVQPTVLREIALGGT